jgi:hypothetical protein
MGSQTNNSDFRNSYLYIIAEKLARDLRVNTVHEKTVHTGVPDKLLYLT